MHLDIVFLDIFYSWPVWLEAEFLQLDILSFPPWKSEKKTLQ